MGMSAGGKRGIKNEINVTPLVDVVLVLLIIFMVVTPMLQRGKDVQLPPSKFAEKEKKDSDPMIVSLTKDKESFLEQDKLSDDALERGIAGKLAETPGRRILLKGDNSLAFADVRKILNVCRKAGAKTIGLGIEEVKK